MSLGMHALCDWRVIILTVNITIGGKPANMHAFIELGKFPNYQELTHTPKLQLGDEGIDSKTKTGVLCGNEPVRAYTKKESHSYYLRSLEIH